MLLQHNQGSTPLCWVHRLVVCKLSNYLTACDALIRASDHRHRGNWWRGTQVCLLLSMCSNMLQGRCLLHSGVSRACEMIPTVMAAVTALVKSGQQPRLALLRLAFAGGATLTRVRAALQHVPAGCTATYSGSLCTLLAASADMLISGWWYPCQFECIWASNYSFKHVSCC